jgi:propionyl-CoA carboxylase beta chain
MMKIKNMVSRAHFSS